MRNRLIAMTLSLLMMFSLVGCIPNQVAVYNPAPSVVTVQSKVNSLPYSYQVAAPAKTAFILVARQRHWTEATINKWLPFALGVMRRESGYCYNVRRGVTFKYHQGKNCVIAKQGPYDDSGFGQVTWRYFYRKGQFLCVQERLCSATQIVSTPYNSMTSFVASLEQYGKFSWCYTATLRAGAVCKLGPAGLPK